LVPGGYLDSLAKTQSVKLTLKNYVINSIASGKGYQKFVTGLKKLVVGTKDTEGSLQKYYRQYAYDKFNQTHEVSNSFAAAEIGLDYFIYQGSVIDSTRAFCEKRAGKVYKISDTSTWAEDSDLVDKKTKATYNPLIERGRYNCRHFINYISRDLALQLGYIG
jgi:hypothetical protein